MRKPTSTCEIWFDGAARGNPGPAGAGAIFIRPNGEEYTNKKYLNTATNNYAEYNALKMGIELAVKFYKTLKTDEPQKLVIRGDSELIIKQLRGEYQVKNEKLKKVYIDVQRLLREIKSYYPLIDIQYEHIPRNLNKKADLLANQAIDENS